MTKSKGVGRGGARKGAGRQPKVSKVDWDAVGRAYFTGDRPIEGICDEFGLSYGDLLAYSTANHWIARPLKRPQHDLGDLASALALEMWGCRSVDEGARRFVAAMTALRARPSDIADVLRMNIDDLKRDYAVELRI